MESPSPSTDMTTDCAMVKHPSSPSASPVGCGAITSVFVQGRAFSGHQFFRPHCAFFAAAASGIARKIDSSIFDNADKFLRLVKSLASQNPFLKQLSTITSQYRNFCQIQRRNHLMKSNSVSSQLNFAAVLPGDSVASVVVANGLMNFLNLYNTLLVVRLVLTWFPNTPPAIVSPLSTICDPYLNIFRGIIPPLGGTLDLSPILAFLVLNAFTSASAALPAELPPPVGSKLLQERSSSPIEMYDDFTSSQKKWMRRMLHGGDRSSKNTKKGQ